LSFSALRGGSLKKKIGEVFDFLKGVRDELSKVVWPKKKEVIDATIGVIVLSGIIAFYFWILDYSLAGILKTLLGR
jgi:preprotein translocase subunit SecE